MVARRIQFYNNSGRDVCLALFASRPHTYCEEGGPMHMPAWITRVVPAKSTETIEIDDQIYAWCDLERGKFGLDSVITGGTTCPAVLGALKGVGKQNVIWPGSSFATETRRHSESTILVPTSTVDTAAEGQFRIVAQRTPPRGELVGVALRGDGGQVLPAMVMKAVPGVSYAIKPFAAYNLVCFSSRIQVGQVLDLRAIKSKVLVDFDSNAAVASPIAAATLNPDGRLSVHFARLPLEAEPAPDAPGPSAHKVRRWHGWLAFSPTTSTTSVTQSIGKVVDALGGKYAWSVETCQTPDGGVMVKVGFWLGDADSVQVDDVYRADWRAAAGAARGKQHAGNETGQSDRGCFPGPPRGGAVGSPVRTR